MASKKKKAPKRPAIKRSLKMAKKRHAIEKKHVQKAVAMKPATAKKLTIVKRPVVAAKQLIIAAQKKRMVPGKVIPLRSHEKLLEALAKKAEEAKKSMAAAREAGRVASPEKLHTEALSLLAEWAPADDEKAKASSAIEAAKGDADKLAKINDRLRFKIAEKGGA